MIEQLIIFIIIWMTINVPEKVLTILFIILYLKMAGCM